MDWWKRVVRPVRRLCFHVDKARCRSHTGGGLLKLHDDIQTCGYEDVQVMWEILRKSETEVTNGKSREKVKQWPIWRFIKDYGEPAPAKC